MGELQLCSPLVVAQSRAEHEACVALAAAPYPTADGFYGDSVTGTAVHFMNQVKKIFVALNRNFLLTFLVLYVLFILY
jgi:hypothetical protein